MFSLRNTDANWKFYETAVAEVVKIKSKPPASGARARVAFWWNKSQPEKFKVQGDEASRLWNALFQDAAVLETGKPLVRSYKRRWSLDGLPRNPEVLEGQKLGYKGSSKILKDNLLAAGAVELPNSDAHHIVAWNDSRAREAQQILLAVKVDINEAANGVFLADSGEHARAPAYYHGEVHTETYHREVTRRLRDAAPGGAAKVREALQEIGRELLKGTFALNK